MKCLKSTLLGVVLGVFSLLVGSCALEALLRLKNRSMTNYDIEMWRYSNELKVQHATLGHDHVTSRSTVLQNVPIRLNSWGIRGAEVGSRAPEERRILFLGSSITFGWGVKEEDTLTSRLQTQLSQSGKKVTVLNAGIGNYNSERYVERFFLKLKDLQPTDVVVHYFLRDAEVLEKGRSNWLLRHSELAVTLWNVWHRLLPGKDGSIVDHYKKIYAADSPGVTRMHASLVRLAEYAKTQHIRLFLAMTPDVHNLSSYPFEEIHAQMRAHADKLGYQYIDLLPSLRGLTPKEVFALPGDPHPNALGHAKMAAATYPVLARY